jgi:glycerol-3-phosphate cytidylyltransferase-like family protein
VLGGLEEEVIARTKAFINEEDQRAGKLIQRTIKSAEILNNSSNAFFTLIADICRDAGLASRVPIITAKSFKAKNKDVATEKIMPGVSSVTITKQIDDASKRARSISQRVNILIKLLIGAMRHCIQRKEKTPQINSRADTLEKSLSRFMKQQDLFSDLITKVVATCTQIKEEWLEHVKAIEYARRRNIYDFDNKFVDEVIINQGKEDKINFIHDMKRNILGNDKLRDLEYDIMEKSPRHVLLQSQHTQWTTMINKI